MKPDASHLPGLEMASAMLREQPGMHAYAQKLEESLGQARAAFERDTRSEAPADYAQPSDVVKPSEPDGAPRDYAPTTYHPYRPMLSRGQGQLFAALIGYGGAYFTIRKMLGDAYDPSGLDLFVDIFCIAFWGFAALYVTYDAVREKLRRRKAAPADKEVKK
ncbi:hypothetical protein [Pseudomonas putida]|uniref:Uncharacterized protein n=1 Tax=Pseudomonas putida TaxID=303 RepID=A0A8I1JMT9_PSEPU|nr:hypothetical protein [Pseudomonas putida]MBI6885820.1 hypothetical protein [Pseudomonas putida]